MTNFKNRSHKNFEHLKMVRSMSVVFVPLFSNFRDNSLHYIKCQDFPQEFFTFIDVTLTICCGLSLSL